MDKKTRWDILANIGEAAMKIQDLQLEIHVQQMRISQMRISELREAILGNEEEED